MAFHNYNIEIIDNKFRNMGFIAAILVVGIHIGEAHTGGKVEWLFHELTKNGICRIAVPYFFIASGFYLTKNFNYKIEVKKRIRTLFIPYIIWSGIYVTFSKLLQIIANIHNKRNLMDNVIVSEQILTWFGLDFSKQPYCVSYWYMRTLMLLVLISPLLLWILCRFSLFCLSLLFILDFIHVPQLLCLQWSSIFYFCTGVALRLLSSNDIDINIPDNYRLWGIIMSLILLISSIVLHYNQYSCSNYLHKLMLPFMIITVFSFMPQQKFPKYILQASFPIYIIHSFILPIISIILPMTERSCIGLMIRWILAIIGTLPFVTIVNKSREIG